MAGSLEFGKLVAASFIYRYWNLVNWLQKAYTVLAVVILIGINYIKEPDELEKRIKKTGNFYGVETIVDKSENDNPINLITDFILQLEKNI